MPRLKKGEKRAKELWEKRRLEKPDLPEWDKMPETWKDKMRDPEREKRER